jgi:hypothetical protein
MEIHLPHSLFSCFIVSLNRKHVTLHEDEQHFKSYLEILLNYGTDASAAHLFTKTWYLDVVSGDGFLKDDPINIGYTRRLFHLEDSKTVELIGRLHGDMFASNSMLMALNACARLVLSAVNYR